MTDIVSAPIFVFVTGVAEVLIVVFAAIFFAYAVMILKNVSDITKLAKKEADKISADLEEARTDIKNGVELTKKRIGVLVSALSVQRALSLVWNGATRAANKKKGKRPPRAVKKAAEEV